MRASTILFDSLENWRSVRQRRASERQLSYGARGTETAFALESPGSLLYEILDLPELCRIAHERGIPVAVDNTWGSGNEVLAAFLMGSGNAAFFSFAALTPKIAAYLKVDVVTLILPMQIMTSFGRSVSPITAAIAGIANVSPFQVVKRTAIPMAVAATVNLTMTFICYYF
ncbi:MAG: PLP-dependent transferase [Enterobacteriaceae bacterium]